MAQILIVEDADDLRDILSEWLFEAGFDAVAVSNANEAKQLLARHADGCLVLLDLSLPDERGEAVLDWIRAHPRHRRDPIIVVTATGIRHVHGSNAIFAKPLNLDALLATIRHHIAKPN